MKEEKLFKYLEMGVIFIDERVLAPSYGKYRSEVMLSKKEKKDVEGETVYMPPMKLRKEMSDVLEREVSGMTEDKMIRSMRGIKKGDLTYDGIEKYNQQYYSWIETIEMLKIDPTIIYKEYIKKMIY